MLPSAAPLDLAFQALADPTRRIMVERLSRSPASVSELARPLDMTLSAVVPHHAVLVATGQVRWGKLGRGGTSRRRTRAAPVTQGGAPDPAGAGSSPGNGATRSAPG